MSEKKFEDELFGDLDLGKQSEQTPVAPALTQVPGFETLSVTNLEALEEKAKLKQTTSSIKSALKEPPPKGPRVNMPVIIAVVFVVLLGGGFGGMYAMGIGFFAEKQLPPVARPNAGALKRLKKKRQLLFIGTKPKGAEVWINGNKYPKKKTPMNLILLPNKNYKFVIKLKGFLPIEKPLQVKAPGAPLSWKFKFKKDPKAKPAPRRKDPNKNGEGYIKLTCNPMGVTVTIGKGDIAKTVKCPATVQIEGGTHPISAEKEGYASYSGDVTVYPAQVITLPINLTKLTKKQLRKLKQQKAKEAKKKAIEARKKAIATKRGKPPTRRRYRPRGKGTVIIACSERARVYRRVGRRWKFIGKTPLTKKLPAGKQRFRIRGRGGAVRYATLRVRYRKTVTKKYTFRKGKIKFKVTPWADVWINGKKIGQTPMAPYKIREGIYKVILRNGKKKQTKRVTVRGNQTAYVFAYF